MRTIHRLLAGMLLMLALAGFAPAQTEAAAPAAPEKLTLDVVFSAGPREALSVPAHLWLADDTALLLDRRVVADQRVIERFDPATGGRTPAVDSAKALASLKALQAGSAEEPPSSLALPEAVDASGRTALYVFDGDIYLLDLAASSFRRLTFTKDEEINPRFSPDGRRLAYVRRNNLFITDLGTGKEKALTRDGAPALLNGTLSWVYWEEIFGREDSAYWWSPDSQAIAFLKTDESMVDESVFPEFEPATPRVIRQRYPKAGGRNPAVQVCIAEVPSGKTVKVRLGEPLPEYVLRVDWLPHSRQVAVQVSGRNQNRIDLLLADRKSGRTSAVLTEENKTWLNVHDDLRFVAGGGQFLWASERDGYNHLYLYDIRGTLVRQLTSGEMMVRASSGVAWVRGGICAVDEKAGHVYFTAISTVPLAPQLYRVPLAGGAVERISAGEGSHRIGFSPSGRYFFDEYSASNQPPSLTVRRSDGGELTVLAAPGGKSLDKYGLRYPEFTLARTDDGFGLPTWILKPPNFDPVKRYPVILYVYGGPGAPVVWNAWSRDLLFNNVLGENGYICVAMDNRCATGLSKALEDTSFRKMMSAYEVPDITAGVRWLKSQPWVDPARVGVWGWSGGGTFTLQLMTHSREFKAGVAVAAVTDFRYYDSRWTEAVLGLPKDNPDGYKAGSPAYFAKDLSGRLLLVHGTYDDNVHPQNAWRFARELQKAGVPFEMMIYPLEKHGISHPGARRHLYQTILDFWLRNL